MILRLKKCTEMINEKNVIIYGAGEVGSKEILMLREDGINPVCFCDANPQKHGKNYCDLRVLQIDEALNKYGKDSYIYISLASPLKEEVIKEFIREGKLIKEQIINYWDIRYKSCDSLEKCMIIRSGEINYCCDLGNLRNQPPHIAWDKNNVEKSISEFVLYRDKLIEDNQNENIITPCTGCPELHYDYWDMQRKVRVLAISLSYPCQYSCTYCSERNANNKPNEGIDELNDEFDLNKVMDYLNNNDLLELSEQIQLSAGEITINKNRDIILDTISKYPVQIFTNGAIYNAKIGNIINKNKNSFINLSIDSGTRETFKKVKGLDAFDQVVINIAKYSQKGDIRLKYILIPDNIAEEDIDGFVNICIKCNIKKVNISADIHAIHDEKFENIVKAATILMQKCKENNIIANELPYFRNDNIMQ